METKYGCGCDAKSCRAHHPGKMTPLMPLIERIANMFGLVGVVGVVPAVEAPLAYLVVRDGKVLEVCTRCDREGDYYMERLFDKDSDMETFKAYDPLGGYCAELHLNTAAWEKFRDCRNAGVREGIWENKGI